MSKKRSREKNFSDSEKKKLLDLIAENTAIIENKETDKVSNHEKNRVWQQITCDFNKGAEIIRQEATLRSCWENIKRKTRSYCGDRRRERLKTGGGTNDIAENSLFEYARSLIATQSVEGLPNLFDSDNVHSGKENQPSTSTGPIITEEEIDDDTTAVFSYLTQNQHIDTWKTWNQKKLNTTISPPLQDIINKVAEQSRKNIEKSEKDVPRKKKRSVDEAKAELADALKSHVEITKNSQAELSKVKIEKEQWKIELLKEKIVTEIAKKKMIEEKTKKIESSELV